MFAPLRPGEWEQGACRVQLHGTRTQGDRDTVHQAEILVLQPLDVPLQFQFRVVCVEHQVRVRKSLLRCSSVGTAMDVPLVGIEVAFAPLASASAAAIVHIREGAHRLVQTDADLVSCETEVDPARFSRFPDLLRRSAFR